MDNMLERSRHLATGSTKSFGLVVRTGSSGKDALSSRVLKPSGSGDDCKISAHGPPGGGSGGPWAIIHSESSSVAAANCLPSLAALISASSFSTSAFLPHRTGQAVSYYGRIAHGTCFLHAEPASSKACRGGTLLLSLGLALLLFCRPLTQKLIRIRCLCSTHCRRERVISSRSCHAAEEGTRC